MMKARAKDRQIFDGDAKPNILAFEDSHGMNAAGITQALNSPINRENVPSEYLFEEIDERRLGSSARRHWPKRVTFRKATSPHCWNCSRTPKPSAH